MKRRAAVLLFAVAAAIGLCLGPAGATGRHHHGHRVLVVDNEHRHRSCLGTRDPFDTIQGAVVAARIGATIWVCPGLYQETVKVDKQGLTLKGANAGRDATRSGRHRESIVSPANPDPDPVGTVQLLADDITWDGFTILGHDKAENGPGMYTSPAHSGYLIRDTIFHDNGVGLHLGSSGRHPTFVCRNRFIANNESKTALGGYGIFSDEGAQQVLITYNRFEGHNGAAIFFADRGAPQQTLLIDHNKSVDDLSFATIYGSTHVRLTHNSARARVGDTEFPGPASAIFIGARNDDVVVHQNRVHSASGNGIDVTDSAEPNLGLKDEPPTSVVVSKNKAEHAQLAGLHMATGTAGVQVTGNTALDNGKWDCQDESTGSGTLGTGNTWQDNLGVHNFPSSLCSPPAPTDQPGHGKGHHHHKKHKKQDPCTCRPHPKAF
jgi:nitrous oxidase accessory protein NosD